MQSRQLPSGLCIAKGDQTVFSELYPLLGVCAPPVPGRRVIRGEELLMSIIIIIITHRTVLAAATPPLPDLGRSGPRHTSLNSRSVRNTKSINKELAGYSIITSCERDESWGSR